VSATTRRLLGLVAGRAWWIAAGSLLGILAIGSNVALMAMSAYLVSRAALATNVAELALAVTAVRVLAIGRATFRYLERYATHAATLRILADLRVWLYTAIEPLAPARLATRRSGDLLARIVADVDTLEDFYVRVVVPPIVAAVTAGLASVLLGVFDATLGFVLLAFLLLTGIGLPLAMRRLSRGPATEAVGRRAELNAAAVDTIAGMADLVALDRAEAHRAGLLALGRALDRTGERLALVRGLGTGLGALLTTLCGVAVVAVAVPLVTGGRLDAVYLALLPMAAIAAFEAVQPLPVTVELLDTSRTAAGRLFELVDAPPAVVDPAEPLPAPAARPAPGIRIDGLSFAYAPGARPALDGVSLEIPSGGSLAITGPSGSGKSTLVSLLLRFWEVETGSIRIGGRELRELRADDVRRLIAVVPQRVDLFDATIRDNLALADPDVTDEAMEAACRMAQLHDAIVALPAGFDTRIGEGGGLLSGGERRRLAIARAILRDAPILILDEATADLDTSTERRLVESLRPFLVGRTTLVISHRPAFAALADGSVRLERGRIVPPVVPRAARASLAG
jgi:thiol reductant ABC exporter CydC subunit